MLKKQTLATFEKGLQHYFNQEFQAAIRAFEVVIVTNSADKPAQLFLDKAAHFIANPVAKEWTGIEKMERK